MQAGEAMLGAADPPPYELVNAQGRAPCLLVCDHASNRVPGRLDGLGLAPRHLAEHIAWDIGAAVMTRRLSECLDAPAVLAGYSRLVVDCNRYLEDPAAFLRESDGFAIKGNLNLTDSERAERVAALYRPYHHVIEERLQHFEANGVAPAFLAVHTMTERMRGAEPRAQDFTLCWALDDRFSKPVLERLRRKGDINVGDNQPYSLDLGLDFTVPEHAMRRGLVHLQIEVRQDLVADDPGALHWADLIYETTKDLIASSGFRTPRHYWPP